MEGCERCKWWSKQGLSPRCPPHDAEWADAQAKAAAEPKMTDEQKRRFHAKLNELWPVDQGVTFERATSAWNAARAYALQTQRSDEQPSDTALQTAETVVSIAVLSEKEGEMAGRFTNIPERLRCIPDRVVKHLDGSDWLYISDLMEDAALKIEALDKELNDLKEARTILLPISREHTEKMVLIGEAFLKTQA